MFEQAFKNIDDILRKEAGCTTELDYTEQTSWLLFLKYLDGREEDLADQAALDLVLELDKDLPDLVLDGVRPGGLLLETVEVWEELLVHEVAEVVASICGIVIKLAVLALGRGPAFPAIGLIENEGVLLALQRRFVGLVLFQAVQVFQE